MDRQRHGVSLHDGRKQFNDNQGKVLRFFCVWDDSDAVGGGVQWFKLHYYLVDNTLEVASLSCYFRNSGRDHTPALVKRTRVPKAQALFTQDDRASGVEDAKGGSARVQRDYIGPTDLRVGGVINVYNRRLRLCDADSFTYNWYVENVGVDMRSDAIATCTDERVEPPAVPPPPYNGIGSEEDSLANCLRVVAKPPKKDMMKMIRNEGRNLRFTARLVLPECDSRSVAAGRRFVVTFFTSDDTFSVYEPRTQNSGVMEGQFLKRQRMRRPDGVYYGMSDLGINAVLTFHSRQFELLSADDYTLSIFEGCL